MGRLPERSRQRARELRQSLPGRHAHSLQLVRSDGADAPDVDANRCPPARGENQENLRGAAARRGAPRDLAGVPEAVRAGTAGRGAVRHRAREAHRGRGFHGPPVPLGRRRRAPLSFAVRPAHRAEAAVPSGHGHLWSRRVVPAAGPARDQPNRGPRHPPPRGFRLRAAVRQTVLQAAVPWRSQLLAAGQSADSAAPGREGRLREGLQGSARLL
mmetsp:Transcript_27472/g.69289  ORF Transcript_27472/g.69289 Transcript_27472/m.69289 type:complete len:214 (+) Transcript_27472:1858-2499(+)